MAERAVESSPKIARDDVVIAASMGPYGAILHGGQEYTGDYGDCTESQLRTFHERRIRTLQATSADILVFETIPRLDEALFIADMMSRSKKPFWISLQLRDPATLAHGENLIETCEKLAQSEGLVAIGINCCAPTVATEALQRCRDSCATSFVVYANSGESYADGTWSGEAAEADFVDHAKQWLDLGAHGIGGCCRVGPKIIKELSCLF